MGIDAETVCEARASCLFPRSAIGAYTTSVCVPGPDFDTETFDGLGVDKEETTERDHVVKNVVWIAADMGIDTDGDMSGSVEREMPWKLRSAPLAVPYGSYIVWVWATIDFDDEVAMIENF